MCACWIRISSVGSERCLFDMRCVCIHVSLLLFEPQIVRMSRGRYPCTEQTHEPPTNTPETEQQQRDHQTPSRSGRPVYYEVAWIAGDETHQKGDEVENGSCKRACQEAEPASDSYSAHDQTDNKANEQADCEIEEFQSCQGKSRLDGQRIHCNLLAGCMKGPRKHEGDQYRQQGSQHPCNDTGNRCIV